MELTQQLREYAAARGLTDQQAVEVGMVEKAEEFRKRPDAQTLSGQRPPTAGTI